MLRIDMQDVPTPPAPPAPPGVPVPTAIALPGGVNVPLGALPTSPSEVRGLRERREELREQLERATNRRSGVIDQLSQTEGAVATPESRAGLQQRLAQIDERILQIERDIATTEQQISSAAPGILAQEAQQDRQSRENGRIDEDEATAIAFSTFGVGIVLTLIVSRWRRHRRGGRDSARGMTTAAFAADDPRLDRLAQTVDAMAEEMERIGEGQRFVTQLLSRRQEAQPLGIEAEGR